MTATPFDSAHLHRLFPAGDIGKLFSDSAEIRAMMIVEGALAKVQGTAGIIPETAARAIHRASLELQVDPGGLAAGTGTDGIPVPALVAAFRDLMQAPEHAQYLHWGAGAQDIQDSALMLRMRQALILAERDLRTLLAALAALAGTDLADTAAGSGWPLLDLAEELPALREGVLWVSLSDTASGADGTGAPALRAALAEALNLHDPGRSWHADRTPVLRIAGWLARLGAALGRMGADLQPALAETAPASTISPAGLPALAALSRHVAGLAATLSQPCTWQEEGADRFTEWLCLPQLVLSAAAALTHGRRLAEASAEAHRGPAPVAEPERDSPGARAFAAKMRELEARPDR